MTTIKAYPLAQASEGEWIRIAQFSGGRMMVRRLTEMGLNIGSEVLVSQHIGGQLVVIRGDTRLALGRGMAHRILVTPADAHDREDIL